MRAGKLDRVITIQAYTRTGTTPGGAPIMTWADVATVRAQIVQASTEEYQRAYGEGGNTAIIFRLRWLDGVTVEHRVDVGDLETRAVVVDLPIGVQHVRADLAAPLDALLLPLQLGHLGVSLLSLEHPQAALEHLHGLVVVLVLRALGLAGDHDPGGQVGEANGRVGLVDVLSTRARRPIGVDPKVGITHFDLDLVVVLDLGAGHDRGEAGLSSRGRVEGRDADQPMHADLRPQMPVGVLADERDLGTTDAGLIALLHVDHGHLVALTLAPAQIHAQQHLGPVLGIDAAGAGIDLDDGVIAVHLAREQALELALLGLGDQALEVGLGGGEGLVVALRLGEFGEPVGVLGLALEPLHRLDPGGEAVALAHQLLRRLAIRPQRRVLGARVQFLEATDRGIPVKDASSADPPMRRSALSAR